MAVESDDPASLLSHYRRLIHLRNESHALRQGAYTLVESSQRPVYAFLRHTDEEILLVLVNLNHREILDYELSLESGPLIGAVTVDLLLGEGDVRPPEINAAGGFAAYRPLDVLPPRSSFVLRLD